MPAELTYPHITKETNEFARLQKHPRTRVSMIVLDYQGRGWSAEEIVRQYPYLTLAEVHSALAYYHDHREEIDQEIAYERAEAERLRNAAFADPTAQRLRALKKQNAA